MKNATTFKFTTKPQLTFLQLAKGVCLTGSVFARMLLYADRTVMEGSVKSCMFNRVDDARLDTAKAAVAAVVDDTSM